MLLSIVQHLLSLVKKRPVKDITRIFSNLIFEGKYGAALKFLDENAEDAVLTSSPSVVNKLQQLHPAAAEIQPHTLLQ